MNVAGAEAAGFAIYYPKPERLDVYARGKYVKPTNVILDEDSQTVFQAPDEGNFVPDISSAKNGDNYFDRLYKKLYIIVKGPEPVDIVVSPVIVLTLNVPAASIDEFYGERLVNNLALLLDISPKRIRVVNVVRETRKKKRAAEATVEVEITDEPSEELDLYGNSTVDDVDAVRENMTNLGKTLMKTVQLGLLKDALNISLFSVEIEEPMPVASSPEWQYIADELPQTGSTKQTLRIPVDLDFVQSSTTGVEFTRFNVIPVLQLLDAEVGVLKTICKRLYMSGTSNKQLAPLPCKSISPTIYFLQGNHKNQSIIL